MAVLDFPRREEFLAEKIGLYGAQAMDTIEKVNLSWQIPPVRVRAQPPLVLLGDKARRLRTK